MRLWFGPAVVFAVSIAASSPRARADDAEVQWQPQWRKVQLFEYIVTGAAGLAVGGIQLLAEVKTSGHYGGVLFDDGVRDLLLSESRSGRDAARVIGDMGYRSMLVFPFLDWAVTWAIHQNDEVAWQMLSINLEVLAVSGLIGMATTRLLSRGRPSVAPCLADPSYESFCYAGSYSSFLSGHTITAAASAAVTCAHHLAMPLYGGGAGDIAACAATSAIALATGITRIVNDRHWATDVVAAWIAGAAVGYVWPRFFHYRDRGVPARERDEVTYLIVPELAPGTYRASIIGMF